MKTIAILAQKGGAGKSTLAVHLAVAGVAAGLRVTIVDLDPQGTVAIWRDAREAEQPDVVTDHPVRLPAVLASARARKVDLVLIDTAPNSDQAALQAAKASELILVPCRPSAFDLAAISTTLDLAQLAKRQAVVVLNAVPPRGNIGAELAEAIERDTGASVAPSWFSQRAAFGHGVSGGRTAQEFEPEGKAAGEVAALFAWLCGHVGVKARPRLRRVA